MSEAKALIETEEVIRVLHVDDQSDFADLTATFLERADDRFTVETASSADGGLERIGDRPPDCIVSDYNMPGMNGFEFLEAVRERYPDLPFILFTGKGSEAIASEAISAGVTDYLRKGSGTEQYDLLANRIRNAVRARREAQRADRQQQLMRLTEFVGDTGGWELDRGSDTVLLTAGTRQAIGRPDRAEIPLEEAIALFHPGDREDVRQTLTEAFEAGAELERRWRLRPRDGDERLIDMTITPVVESGGTVTKLRGAGHDVTDREERRRELETYETIIEALTDAVYVLDEEGRFTYVNDEFVELVGYDRETILGNTPSLVKDEAAVERGDRNLRRLLSSDGPETISFEVTLQPREGEPIVCTDHMGVLPYEGDRFDGSVGTLRDVTAARERERTLERQNDLFTKAQNIADVGAWSYDVRTDEAFLTDKAYAIHGLSPDDELTPERSLDFYHPEDRPAIRDAFDRAVETGESYDLELRLIDTADDLRWVRTRGDAEPEDGNVVCVRGTLQDITERKRRERALEDRTEKLETLTSELEEQYRHLFEEAPLMAVVTRAEEGEPIIEDCNDLFVDTLGYEKSELVGAKLERFYTAESRRKLLDEGGYERALGDEFVRENRSLVTAGGETVETLFRAVPRKRSPEGSRGTIAFYVNVTERKRLERERDRLEEFTSIVSHDLRNPLTVADGHIELAREECDSDHLARVADAIDRSQALIDDLLTLAREGREVTGSEPVELTDVVKRSWETVDTEHATLEANATQVVKAHRSRLQQLFENLYRNAVEHGGDGVTVHVGDLDGGFYVADTGSGIPESDRDEIFEAGYSTADHGTGFGLRIVEQMVEAHGWDIRVVDGERRGARFEITGVETTH
ncbi:PAS domain S-box protein [Haloplanus natans]|uniref:PAS domain S-box protein n=1 Tax=Haloplanus natans TaxID=376171 RepID=UPI00067769C1|nr:PAS domain S-box protein [Haloplanus natans]